MATAFQSDAFQNDAFQIDAVSAATCFWSDFPVPNKNHKFFNPESVFETPIDAVAQVYLPGGFQEKPVGRRQFRTDTEFETPGPTFQLSTPLAGFPEPRTKWKQRPYTEFETPRSSATPPWTTAGFQEPSKLPRVRIESVYNVNFVEPPVVVTPQWTTAGFQERLKPLRVRAEFAYIVPTGWTPYIPWLSSGYQSDVVITSRVLAQTAFYSPYPPAAPEVAAPAGWWGQSPERFRRPYPIGCQLFTGYVPTLVVTVTPPAGIRTYSYISSSYIQ